MKRSLLLLVSTLMFLPFSAFAQPSFDCAKATTATEITICSSGRLAELDVALSAAYAAARSQLDEAGRNRLLAEQKIWLAQRDSCRSDALCLAASMEARLARLTNPGGGMASTQTSPQPAPDGSTFTLPNFGAQLSESNTTSPSAASAVPDGIWNARFTCGKGNRVKDYAARLLTTSEHGLWAFFQVAPMDEANLAPAFALLHRNENEDAGNGLYTKEFARGIRGVWRIFIRPSSDQLLTVDYGPCTNIQFVREQPALKNPNFEGRWSGLIEACDSGGGAVETKMTVIAAHEGNVFADVGYRLFPNEPPGKDYPGRAFLYGVWDAAWQEYRFAVIKTGGPARSGDSGYTWGGLANLSLKHDGADGSLVGKTDKCSYAEFRKDDPAQLTQTAGTVPTKGLSGRWEGEAICRNGDTFLGLTINAEQSDRILGVLDIAGPDALMRGVNALDVQLRKGDQADEFEGAVEYAQASLQSFRLAPGDNGNTLTISENDLGCGDVELSRIDETALSRLPTATAPDGGSYFANRRPQDRCEAIVALPKKFEREFPEVSMLNDPSEKVYPKLVLLYGDDDWIQVFGQPFDAMPLNERREIRNEARQLCYNDPFYSDDYYKFSMLDRGLNGNLERPLTSFGLPAIHIAVRQIRKIRHQLRGKVENAIKAPTVEEAAPLARSVSTFMKNNRDRLWPSEIDETERKLSDHLVSLSLKDMEVALAEADRLNDPTAKLIALTEMAEGKQEYHRYLDDRRKADLKTRVEQEQSQLAASLLSAAFAQLEELPSNEPALAAFEEQAADIHKTTALLTERVAVPFEKKITQKRQSILDSLLSKRVSSLNALPSGPDGLSASLDWLEEFKRLFGPYQEQIAFDSAMKTFSDKRSNLLEGALPQFEQEVARAAESGGSGSVDQITSKYLAWEGDEAFPVWLDYQFIADSYK